MSAAAYTKNPLAHSADPLYAMMGGYTEDPSVHRSLFITAYNGRTLCEYGASGCHRCAGKPAAPPAPTFSLQTTTADKLLHDTRLMTESQRRKILADLQAELGRLRASLECPASAGGGSIAPHGAPLGGLTLETSFHTVFQGYRALVWTRDQYLSGLTREIEASVAPAPDGRPRAPPSNVLRPLAEWAARRPGQTLVPVPGTTRIHRHPDGREERSDTMVPDWAAPVLDALATAERTFAAQRAAAAAKAEEDRIAAEVARRVSAIRYAEAARVHAEEEAARKAVFEAEVARRVAAALGPTV